MLQSLQCHITKKNKKTKNKKPTQPTQDPLQSMSLFFCFFCFLVFQQVLDTAFRKTISLWASVSVCLQSCTKTIDNLTQNKTSKLWQKPAKQKEQNCAPMNHPKTSDMGFAFFCFLEVKEKTKHKIADPMNHPKTSDMGCAAVFFGFF